MIQKLILFFALLFTVTIVAQKQQASPYSFFGIGNNFLSKTVEESMMGGIGTAISDPLGLNFSNPAAQSGLKFTTYTVAAINTQNEVSDLNSTQKNSVFSLSYLAIGVPLADKGALTAGLRARTGVGYTLFATNESNDQSNYTFEGSGGASSFFIGGGYTILKGFSVGLEAAFVFGEIEHVVTEKQTGVAYDTREKATSALRGLEAKLGFFYTKKVGTANNLNFGLSFVNANKIKVTETSTFYKGVFSAASENIKLTLDPIEVKGNVVNALNTTMAIAYGKKSVWQSSIEYSFNKPQSFEGETLTNNTRGVVYTDYARYAIGGYYIPKFNSLTSYFQRVIYRAGLKYENTGMELSGTPINDLGISFGLGLPLGKGLTHLNVGLEYGIKGEVTDTLVEEKYFNVRMSMSLGDKWFRKRRID
tara:strand:+ start:1754 stop:3013 length:1260 start_codon:yes stop_codon:yes gene_type:complete